MLRATEKTSKNAFNTLLLERIDDHHSAILLPSVEIFADNLVTTQSLRRRNNQRIVKLDSIFLSDIQCMPDKIIGNINSPKIPEIIKQRIQFLPRQSEFTFGNTTELLYYLRGNDPIAIYSHRVSDQLLGDLLRTR